MKISDIQKKTKWRNLLQTYKSYEKLSLSLCGEEQKVIMQNNFKLIENIDRSKREI